MAKCWAAFGSLASGLMALGSGALYLGEPGSASVNKRLAVAGSVTASLAASVSDRDGFDRVWLFHRLLFLDNHLLG